MADSGYCSKGIPLIQGGPPLPRTMLRMILYSHRLSPALTLFSWLLQDYNIRRIMVANESAPL